MGVALAAAVLVDSGGGIKVMTGQPTICRRGPHRRRLLDRLAQTRRAPFDGLEHRSGAPSACSGDVTGLGTHHETKGLPGTGCTDQSVSRRISG